MANGTLQALLIDMAGMGPGWKVRRPRIVLHLLPPAACFEFPIDTPLWSLCSSLRALIIDTPPSLAPLSSATGAQISPAAKAVQGPR